MAVDHLKMAIEMLRNCNDDDGPEDFLFAIGLAAVALVERVELLVALAMRFVAATEEIVTSIERHRWAGLTPDEREAVLKAEGLISGELDE